MTPAPPNVVTVPQEFLTFSSLLDTLVDDFVAGYPERIRMAVGVLNAKAVDLTVAVSVYEIATLAGGAEHAAGEATD